MGVPKKLCETPSAILGPAGDLFLDFWGSHRTNNWIWKLISQKLIRGSNKVGLDLFPDPFSHFVAPGGHFGFSRWRGVPGGAALQAVSDCPRHCLACILYKNMTLGVFHEFFIAFCVFDIKNGSNKMEPSTCPTYLLIWWKTAPLHPLLCCF